MIEYAEAQRQSDASPDGTSLPLSVQQTLWWCFDEAYGSANCQASARLEFRGRIDHEALRAAFERLLSRHAVLRTKIREVGGLPRQSAVAASAVLAFNEHHLDGRWAAQRLCRLDARQPLSLKNGPLVRGSLMRLPDHAYVLQITLHPIVCDGESLNWLLRELLLLYRAALTGNEDAVHNMTITYGQQFLDDDQGRAEVHDRTMEERSSTGFPLADVPRSESKRTGTSADAGVRIPAALAIKLRRMAQEQGVGLYTILVCAWISLLGRGVGEADVVIGIETSSRSRLIRAPVIGPFADLVPMRIHLDEASTVDTLLQDVDRAVRLPGRSEPELWRKVFEARAHGGWAKPVIPLAVCACPPLSLGDLASIDVPGLTVERVWMDRHWPCAEISVCLEERGMNPVVTLRCANDIMELETVQHMADRLLTSLDAVGMNRRWLISKLPLTND